MIEGMRLEMFSLIILLLEYLYGNYSGCSDNSE